MTKYILHGGHTNIENDLNRSYFAEMVNDVPEQGNMLIVYFASDDDKVEDEFLTDCELIRLHAGDKSISIVKANHENFIKQLEDADVVYIRGGKTRKLRKALREYPNFTKKLKNKTVSGLSAGAYVLSKYYFTNSEGVVCEGFGCLPIRTCCHYQSPNHKPVNDKDPVEELNKYDNELELVLLKDCEWRVFEV